MRPLIRALVLDQAGGLERERAEACASGHRGAAPAAGHGTLQEQLDWRAISLLADDKRRVEEA